MTTDDLLTRAVETVVPRDLAEKKLKSGKKIRLYLGIDPTGAKLHIGHSVPLRKLKAFQEAGHEVIFLIGSFTAMVGDPSGRDTMREPLTKEQVQKNFETYREQTSKILDFSKIELRFNHEWLEKLGFAEIMKLASHFTVQQMMQREMFKERMRRDDPLSPNEFLYPLMQGYDSVMLDVDCELGGNDQLFNMLCGRTLQAAYGKREKFVLTTKLIEGTDGRKMSKTYDNCVYLEDEPNDMFGKVMSVNDDLMALYFECCTDVAMDEVKKILGGKPRDAKARLAREITALYHGNDAAAAAEEAFNRVFKDKGLPDEMPEVKVKKDDDPIGVIMKAGLVSSRSEGRRLLEQGAITINGQRIIELESTFGEGFAGYVWGKDAVIKVGKRKFVRIKIQ